VATNPILDESIDFLSLPVRICNTLKWNKIEYVSQLVQISERRFMEFRGVSKTSLGFLNGALAAHGLRLGMVIKDVPNAGQREAELKATIERLTKERDEARKWSCMWEALARTPDGAKAADKAHQLAELRGWDCFAQEAIYAQC
jgi:hypothetical protein